MASHNQKGKAGEDFAAQYILKKGFIILHRNWRKRPYEVDIIALDENLLVFIEVKSRTHNFFGEPEESVDQRKQKHLLEAAELYLEEIAADHEVRFDIISVIDPGNGLPVINHIKDAFSAS